MRPIGIRVVYVLVSIAFIVVGLGGGIVRGCERDDQNDRIARQERRLCILQSAEGKAPTRPDICDARWFFSVLKDQMTTRHKSSYAVLEEAAHLNATSEETLMSLDNSGSWKTTRGLAIQPYFADVVAMQLPYSFDDILAGKITPSTTIVIESRSHYWEWTFWRLVWLCASLCAVAAFVCDQCFSNGGKHPVMDYPWQRVDGILLFLVTGPASIPALLLYILCCSIYFVLTSEWSETWRIVRTFMTRAGYQLRIVRKLPAPVIAPATYHANQQQPPVVQAQPVATAQATPATEWYMVRRNTFLGVEHLLAAAGVQVFPLAITIPKKVSGYAVPADSITRFEEIIGVKREKRCGAFATGANDTATNIERTMLRQYTRDHDIDVCVSEVYNDAKRATLERVAKIAALRAGCRMIAIDCPPRENLTHGERAVEVVWSETKTFGPLKRLYEKNLADQYDVHEPDPGKGVLIRDTEGIPVAQVINTTVYMLVRGFVQEATEGDDWALEMLTRILHEAIVVSLAQDPDAEETDDDRRSAWRSALDKEREGYVELCFRRLDAQRKNLKRDVDECSARIMEMGESLRKEITDRRAKQSALDGFMTTELPKERERLRTEFDQLVASPCVIAIEANQDGVVVFTKTVEIAWRGKRYRIGRFKVTLAYTGSITIKNIANTAKDSNYEHPHVHYPSNTCWGNMHATVMELMGDREYASVITMIHRFLEVYNPHGGVEEITKWKEVS